MSVSTESFLESLNSAVKAVPAVPRVRFDCDVGADAELWIKKKHANGAIHEPATIAAFLAIREHRDCRHVFDLGALFGYFSLACLNIFENAAVTVFEMHPAAISVLLRNVYPMASIVHGVVSDTVQDPTKVWVSGFNIYECPEGGWDNLASVPGAMKQRGDNNRGRFFYKVGFTTIDAFCAVNHPPDMLKIDVEGYQAKAILGGLETFRQHRPAIVIELHDPEKLQRFGTTNKATVQPLFDLGYRGFWCGNHRGFDARFEPVSQMGEQHEKLSLMVFVP